MGDKRKHEVNLVYIILVGFHPLHISRYKTLFTSFERICTKDYKIPNTGVIVPKDGVVHVYVENITNSDKNFVNPHNFDPENFNPQNFSNKFAYFGFGQGPRSCPGR